MQYGLTKYADSPTGAVMTLAEAKLHLRVDFTDDDDLISALIEAATLDCEAYCNASFVPATYHMTLGAFPARGSGLYGPDEDGEEFPRNFGSSGKPTRYPTAIFLPVHPLLELNSLTYMDADGATQTLSTASYVTVSSRRPPFIVPATGTTWPVTYDHPEAVTVSFNAGFATIPADIVAAVKLRLATLYEHREEIVVGTIQADLSIGSRVLLGKYRLWPLP